MKRFFKKKIIFPVAFVGLFFLGPRPSYPGYDSKLPKLKLKLTEVDTFVKTKEANLPRLKDRNASSVIWADGIKRTPYSVVYLHGFSASPMEGDPIHREFAQRYGCNLYLPLIAGHGQDDDETFLNISPRDWIESAKEAIAIGQLLGEKVIVMSCSTGGTLSTYLAAYHPEVIHAQVMYSPNIDLYSGASRLLTMPWGQQMARLVMGGDYIHSKAPAKYWNKTYRIEGAVALKTLIAETMTVGNFKKITQPLFMGYYYKNEEEQDKVVSIGAMKHFFSTVSTPENKKWAVPFPNAGNHVVTSELQSKDLDDVRAKTFAFAEKVLGLQPVWQEDPSDVSLMENEVEQSQ